MYPYSTKRQLLTMPTRRSGIIVFIEYVANTAAPAAYPRKSTAPLLLKITCAFR